MNIKLMMCLFGILEYKNLTKTQKILGAILIKGERSNLVNKQIKSTKI